MYLGLLCLGTEKKDWVSSWGLLNASSAWNTKATFVFKATAALCYPVTPLAWLQRQLLDCLPSSLQYCSSMQPTETESVAKKMTSLPSSQLTLSIANMEQYMPSLLLENTTSAWKSGQASNWNDTRCLSSASRPVGSLLHDGRRILLVFRYVSSFMFQQQKKKPILKWCEKKLRILDKHWRSCCCKYQEKKQFIFAY